MLSEENQCLEDRLALYALSHNAIMPLDERSGLMSDTVEYRLEKRTDPKHPHVLRFISADHPQTSGAESRSWPGRL